MKTLTLSLITLLAVSCAPKKDSGEAAAVTTDSASVTDAGEWVVMDEFHMVMAESFHPYLDSGNLGPAKRLAPEMEAVATRWAKSPLPEKVDYEDMKIMLDAFSKETIAFARLVAAGGTDEELGESLTQMHDHFHALEEVWYGSGDHENHEP